MFAANRLNSFSAAEVEMENSNRPGLVCHIVTKQRKTIKIIDRAVCESFAAVFILVLNPMTTQTGLSSILGTCT